MRILFLSLWCAFCCGSVFAQSTGGGGGIDRPTRFACEEGHVEVFLVSDVEGGGGTQRATQTCRDGRYVEVKREPLVPRKCREGDQTYFVNTDRRGGSSSSLFVCRGGRYVAVEGI